MLDRLSSRCSDPHTHRPNMCKHVQLVISMCSDQSICPAGRGHMIKLLSVRNAKLARLPSSVGLHCKTSKLPPGQHLLGRAISSMSKLYPVLDLQGQTVLITGASSGIGEACAWRFAEAGCKLILSARRTDRLNALSQQLQETYKVPIHTVTLDVQDYDKTQQLPAQLPKDFQEVDILLNNAGLALGTAKVHENSIEQLRQMVDTNVTAVAILTKLFAAGMVERNRGHIINISSVAAHHAYPGGSIYSGTKHFIDAFTNSARHDLVGTDIRVTAISPGAVQTEFSKVRYSGDEDKAAAVYDGIIPLNAADVADNVLYAATRPAHVQIAEVVTYATYQSGPTSKANVVKKNTN